MVYRYLPDKVGQIMVRYLWVVLPFWQTLLSLQSQSEDLSAFL